MKVISKQDHLPKAQQKKEIPDILQDLKCEEHTGKKIDWNTNDFELVNAVKELAKRFCDKVVDMRKQNKDFDTLFSDIETQKETLSDFTGAVSEANYIDKAENFLTSKDSYIAAVQTIEKVEKFIRNNLPNLLKWKSFVEGVNDVLKSAAKSNDAIAQLTAEFNTKYGKEVVKNFAAIQQTAQKIKDEYYNLMQSAAKDMADKYTQLKIDAEALIKEINTLPEGLNREILNKSKAILQYATQRTQSKVDIDYDIKDKHSRFTYSEMLSFIELFKPKKTDIEILKAGLIREAPPKPEQGQPYPVPKTIISTLPARKLKVYDYKQWLQKELQKLSGVSDNDEIEIKE